MIGGGGRYSMAGCVRKDEMWIWMMRIEAECYGVVIAELRGSSEEEGVLACV